MRWLTSAVLGLMYGFAVFVCALFLKPLLIALTVLTALGYWLMKRDPEQSAKHDCPYPAVLVVLLLPLAAAGYLAPARELALWALSGSEKGPTSAFVARLMMPGRDFDFAVACAGLWFGCSALVLGARWHWRQRMDLRNLATSTARAVAVGLCELKGRAYRAQPEDLEGFPPKTVLGHRLYTVPTSDGQEIREESKLPLFYLRDATGQVLVDPAAASVRKSWMPLLFGSRFCEIALLNRSEDLAMGVRRRWIEEGDPVYLVGHAEPRPDARPDAKDSERLVIRAPKGADFFENLVTVMLWGLGGRVQAAFFLSDTNEDDARAHMRRAFFIHVLWALAWLFLSHRHLDYAPPERWFTQHRVESPYTDRPARVWSPEKLAKALDDVDPDTRLAALEALSIDSRLAPVFAKVGKMALSDRDERARGEAVRALALWARRDRAALSEGRALLAEVAERSLSSGPERSRKYACDILGELAPLTQAQAAALGSALSDPEVAVRRTAAWALLRGGSSAAPAEAALERAWRQEADPDAKQAALQAYANARLPAERSAPFLAGLLTHAEPGVRETAASGLGKLAEAAAPQAGALARLLEDPEKRPRFFAAQALELIGPAACSQQAALEAALAAERARDSRSGRDDWTIKSLETTTRRCR